MILVVSDRRSDQIIPGLGDLTEQFGDLAKQITLLNGKIGEQSNIIVTQNTTIAKQSAKVVELEGACTYRIAEHLKNKYIFLLYKRHKS